MHPEPPARTTSCHPRWTLAVDSSIPSIQEFPEPETDIVPGPAETEKKVVSPEEQMVLVVL